MAAGEEWDNSTIQNMSIRFQRINNTKQIFRKGL